MRSTRKLTLSGILAAVGVVVLLLGCALPNGKMAAAALASLSVSLCLMAYGYGGGSACYLVTAFLSALLVPEKTIVIFYAAFFGPYMILKLAGEQLRHPAARWCTKLIGSGVLLGCTWLCLSRLMGWADSMIPGFIWFVWPAALIVYDVALSRLLGWLYAVLRPLLR